ncbi:MAG: hypothetical protein ACT4QF_11680 [Sporichthyaceae bacterium]
MSHPYYEQYAADDDALAGIGQALFGRRTRVTVRLPAALAARAVASWDRDDDENFSTDGETREQRTAGKGSGARALIGLAIAERGRRDGEEVVVDLDAWEIGTALDAAEARDLLDGLRPPPD